MEFDELYSKLLKQTKTPTKKRELAFLSWAAAVAFKMNPNCCILELGTLNGVSAMIMADRIEPPAQIITVDSYRAFHHNEVLRKGWCMSYSDVRKTIQEMGYSDRITAVEGDDIEYLNSTKDQSIMLLVLDSLHTYTHVKPTLDIAIPKMEENAMICGHDYQWGERNVIYAVEDWRKENAYDLCGFGLVKSMWWTILRRKIDV